MKKVLLIAAAMLAALVATVGFAPTASAYPEQTCNVDVSAQVVNEGDEFTATGTATTTTTPRTAARAAAEGDFNWVMTFNGETRNGSGDVFTQTFTAPQVSVKTVFPLTAKAVMEGATTECERTVDITVLPGGTVIEPPGEELPNTGGPHLSILIAGIALVVAGAYAVRQSRRRHLA